MYIHVYFPQEQFYKSVSGISCCCAFKSYRLNSILHVDFYVFSAAGAMSLTSKKHRHTFVYSYSHTKYQLKRS